MRALCCSSVSESKNLNQVKETFCVFFFFVVVIVGEGRARCSSSSSSRVTSVGRGWPEVDDCDLYYNRQ